MPEKQPNVPKPVEKTDREKLEDTFAQQALDSLNASVRESRKKNETPDPNAKK